MTTIFAILSVILIGIGMTLVMVGLIEARDGNINDMGYGLVVSGIGVIFILAGAIWLAITLGGM